VHGGKMNENNTVNNFLKTNGTEEFNSNAIQKDVVRSENWIKAQNKLYGKDKITLGKQIFNSTFRGKGQFLVRSLLFLLLFIIHMCIHWVISPLCSPPPPSPPPTPLTPRQNLFCPYL
jgi:hypothetical protein